MSLDPLLEQAGFPGSEMVPAGAALRARRRGDQR